MEVIIHRPGKDLKPELSIILASPNKLFLSNVVTQLSKKERDITEILYPLEEVENVPQAYNKMLSCVNSAVVVFIREGWIPALAIWVELITTGLQKYNMVGTIGTSWISTHAPLWSVVRSDKIFGSVMVMPEAKNGKPLLYKYEPAPAQVVCLDGGFMAIRNPEQLRFDETLKYFYDIDFSMRIYLGGGRVAVLPILMQCNDLTTPLDSKVNAALIMFRTKWESKFPCLKIGED